MQTVCNTYWDAGKGNLTAQNTRKPFGGRGSVLDPAEGAYSAPANPLVGGEGLAVPSLRTPSPRSRPIGPRLSYPPLQNKFRRRCAWDWIREDNINWQKWFGMALLIVDDDSCVNWLESSNLLYVYVPISLGILSDYQCIELVVISLWQYAFITCLLSICDYR